MINNLLQKLLLDHYGSTIPGGMEDFLKAISNSFEQHEQQVANLEGGLLACKNRVNELEAKLFTETTELKETHAELTRLFTQVHEGFFTRDIAADRYTHMSVGCEKIYGYSIKEFFANPALWYEVIHPDDRSIMEAESEQLVEGKSVVSTYRILRRDGETRWLEVKA